MRMIYVLQERSRRTEITEAAIQQRRIDFVLQCIEHAVDESDQIVQRGNRLIGVAIGDGVENRNVTVDRPLQVLTARNLRVVQPADAAEYRMQGSKRVLHERLTRRGHDELIGPSIDAV